LETIDVIGATVVTIVRVEVRVGSPAAPPSPLSPPASSSPHAVTRQARRARSGTRRRRDLGRRAVRVDTKRTLMRAARNNNDQVKGS
jgi:hypothetical protein